MNWSQGTTTMFQDGSTDWSRMKAGFEELVSAYPDPWNINNFARFACIAGDWRTMGRLSEKIGEAPIPAAWHDDTRYYLGCRSAARGR